MSRPTWSVLAISLLAGCAGSSGPGGETQSQPIGVQIMHAAPDLKGQRFTNLLNFEVPTDSVFVSADGLKLARDSSHAHTGQHSLRADGRNGTIKIKLGSVLGNRQFPADWTLGGAFFYSEKPAELTVVCYLGTQILAQNRVHLAPGQWAAVLVDLANPAQRAPTGGDPSLCFSLNSAGAVWLDDALLIDNTEWIAGPAKITPQSWSLVRRGFQYVFDVPGSFTTKLTTIEATPTGWQIEEANEFRSRFKSTGENKALTIYPDGRSYWDGKFRGLSAATRGEPLYAQQERSPAQVEIPESMGRLDRRSPGDADNDGYNEARGSYMIVATGPRLELKLVPQSIPVLRPVLEVAGLPEGKPLVTIEGRLLEHTFRLADGTLLVDIPARIDRATTVNLRIQ